MPESLPHHRLPLGNQIGRHQARKRAPCPESIPSTGRPDQPAISDMPHVMEPVFIHIPEFNPGVWNRAVMRGVVKKGRRSR